MIDRATVDKILDAANIVDVISEFVSLRKRGTSYKGLCPFHEDHTPSFSVSPSKGIYKCFSCGESGNVVNFIMKHEQLTYPEALRWLAHKYNIEIQERELTDEEREQESERESMFIVNEWAAKYFEDILHHDVDGLAVGMQYFRSRGFRDDIILKFGLGFSLSNRHALADAALKAGYKREFLVSTGLCYERDNGELTDRFAGRVIFPWRSMSGKVIAFGGRLLDSRTKGVNQKYVNSPDSVIYHKDHELYGIYQAKKAIQKHDLVYMVEGYTDVIAMHQCGIENVVANSGTALSLHQVRMLHKLTDHIVFVYDGDEAGIHAALRGTDFILSEGMNLKVLLLPDGDDPDSFSRKHTASEFESYIKEHQTDFIVFKISQLLNGVTDPARRSEAINDIVRSISVIRDPILRDTYIRECSSRTGTSEQTLIATMNRFIHADREQQQRQTGNTPQAVASHPEPFTRAEPMQQASKVEDMIIQTVIRHGNDIILRDIEDENGHPVNLTVAQYISYSLSADALSFSKPIYNTILGEAVEHCADPEFSTEAYFVHHPDINISTLASQMSADTFHVSKSLLKQESEADLRDRVMHMLLDFRMDYVENRLKELKTRVVTEQDPEQQMQIMQELKKMQDVRNAIAQKLGSNIVI